MAVQGPFVFLNRAKLKVLTGGGTTINLTTDTFKAALCTSVQALDGTFLGSSTDARYADLTAELTTANGYTAGGLALSSLALTRFTGSATNDSVAWDCADLVWTLTGGITFKYLVIYDFTATNKDIIALCDMDTGGGSVSPLAGTLTVAVANIETFK